MTLFSEGEDGGTSTQLPSSNSGPIETTCPSQSSRQSGLYNDKNDPPCPDCNKNHLPRRLVICVDGTWMDPDGPITNRSGNASNMFRIWCLVKQGTVSDDEGKFWFQIRAPFVDGVGVVDDYVERLYSGVTGSGYEMKILEVYRLCCDMCSKDDVFLFGYSRGAFIVRAVSGLLHHLRSLKPDISDFEGKFLKSLRAYRAAQDKSTLSGHSVFRHLSENTKRAPRVRFLGLIDTVKALNDDNLHDIGTLQSVCHVRHALALFEKRTVTLPERYDIDRLIHLKPKDHSVQEAWFAGTHGNLGGGQVQDGLALWPLHWLVTEAQKNGLAIGFEKIENTTVTDPATLVSLQEGIPRLECVQRYGLRTQVSDFNKTLEKSGFYPWIGSDSGSFPSVQEFRTVYEEERLVGATNDESSGCFIHPSVFLLDHTDVSIIQAISMCPFGMALRAEQHFVTFPNHSMFWALRRELEVNEHSERPRILVCGQVNAGKSSLVDAVLERDESEAAHGATPGEHSTNVGFESENREVILHDSKGFESGTEMYFDAVQEFLTERRAQPYFQDQIHCVWYCVSTDLLRIQEADKKFASMEFGGVPVMLIFTKTDKLRNEKKIEALKAYNKENKVRLNLEDLGSLPTEQKEAVLSRASTLLAKSTAELAKEWTERLAAFSSVQFVESPEYSNSGSETIDKLVHASVAALTSDVVAKIHANAQEMYLKPKLEELISDLLHLCDRKADFWTCLTTFKAEAYRRELVNSAIQSAAKIFQFEGFRHAILTSIILDTLWPPKSNDSAVVPGQALRGITLGAAMATVKLIPLFAVVTVPLTVANSTMTSLKQSNALVFACVEIVLIFDRLFWFGDKHIDEKHVTAAALHYLKIRQAVLAELEKSITITKDILQMEPAVLSVVEKYRYRRRDRQA